MAGIEAELWNIFTFYSLHGNPLDPERMSGQLMLRLAKDCDVLEPHLYDNPLSAADVNLIFAAEAQRSRKAADAAHELESASTAHGSSANLKLTYYEFLNVLLRISQRLYGHKLSQEDAMQKLLMENVLPRASRRNPASVSRILRSAAFRNLYDYYKGALKEIFMYYASAQHTVEFSTFNSNSSKGKAAPGKPTKRQASRLSMVRAPGDAPGDNSMTNAMSYAAFIRMANDLGLSNLNMLTTLELGDVFISSICDGSGDPEYDCAGAGMKVKTNSAGAGMKVKTNESSFRKLSFREFWEALVRCALVAYRNDTLASDLDKFQGLLLSIWRTLQSAVPGIVNSSSMTSGSRSTNKGGLLRGAQLLNERFIQRWQEDNYRDYLALPAAPKISGRSALKTLLYGEDKQQLPQGTGSGAAAGAGGPASTAQVTLRMAGDNATDSSLGDPRISMEKLQRLITRRPWIADVLQKALEEAGLVEG
eukprot:CAMPEP_0118862584 /NCGR_PEP_ID=MMETSP1163-20130328/7737_1 /TAXON_ID=124430 /ORGANISM="Phaeomonas parva, Strain CCMP2877" /LENGTH=477 /DNA_ID=CAMNT_0006796501 /DNA_START=10 /DNA_END=1443 /DNA_ORIENTATION=+